MIELQILLLRDINKYDINNMEIYFSLYCIYSFFVFIIFSEIEWN